MDKKTRDMLATVSFHKNIISECGEQVDEDNTHSCYSCHFRYVCHIDGINEIMLALEKRGIDSWAWNSGGWNMLATIGDLDGDYVCVSTDLVSYYTPEHPEGIVLGDYARCPFGEDQVVDFLVDIVVEHKNLFKKVSA